MKEQEELESVAKNCHHLDCIYRSSIESGHTPICYYAVLAGEPRGCKISECDKYVAGEKIKPKLRKWDLVIFWECNVYDEDADAFW